jgi:cholesterol oxidase
MTPSSPPPTDDFDADFLIVGSGFGGSVSALRLVEKGYRVLVLEAGRRFAAEDFPRTNWNLRKFLWAPALGCYGIQRITPLRDALVLSGAGVGGGSLVYANTLLIPPRPFFVDPRWGHLDDWERALAPHYQTALRMLGATPARFIGRGDEVLREVAEEMGRGDTFHQPTVAVYFGQPGETVPDPFFGGEGPARSGCVLCGGCMVGCRYRAKNTLDYNYLYLAEKRGATVVPLTTVEGIAPREGGGYLVTTRRTGAWIPGPTRRAWRARQVVLAAGVVGTVPLLMSCKQAGLLPALSDRLGDVVRTNSEAIVGAMSRDPAVNHSQGIAITSGFYPEDDTHIEVVRYGRGQDAMGRLATLMVDGGVGWARRLGRWLGAVVTHPLDFLRTLVPWGFAKASVILLVMQTRNNHMRLRLRRRWWWPFRPSLGSETPPGQARPPTYIPVANQVARRVAAKTDGIALGAINEAFWDAPITAHILGGCTMGDSAERGVIDRDHQVFGYPGLYVLDGSAVSANLGVNPALTICALTEYACSKIPARTQMTAGAPVSTRAPARG